jgi:hypothetical protein
MMTESFVDIHCRGCRRFLGIGPEQARMYCDRRCADDYQVSSEEGRDALIYAISTEKNWSYPRLAAMFGCSRQRINQIVMRQRRA